MTKVKTQIIKYAAVTLIVLGGFFAYFETAGAQTFYPTYTPQSQQEFIAYLYGIIAQLQAQNGTGVAFQPQNTFAPTGSVLGATNSFGSSFSNFNVEVFTSGANNIDDDEAWVFGTVDLNGAQFADVWFEYGTSRSMNERSRSGRITQRTSETFRGDLDGLREDETYFFRAVAQDPSGFRTYGQVRTFESDEDSRSRISSRRNDDDEPDAFTDDVDDIDEDSAEINGEVDMNDFRNGLVFFAYGEDEDDVEDVEDEDEFDDIDERGDDLQLIVVDRDLDDDDDYAQRIGGLDDDTEYYYRICVEYEDEDDDETLECGDVEEFETDRD